MCGLVYQFGHLKLFFMTNIFLPFPHTPSSRSGVQLKWLVLDHLFVTSGGRLQVGGLTGAVMGSSNSSGGK